MRNLILHIAFGLFAGGMGFYACYLSNTPRLPKPKTEQVDSLSSLPYIDVKEKGVLREVDKASGITVYEYKKGDRVYTVFTSEYDYINAVREK